MGRTWDDDYYETGGNVLYSTEFIIYLHTQPYLLSSFMKYRHS